MGADCEMKRKYREAAGAGGCDLASSHGSHTSQHELPVEGPAMTVPFLLTLMTESLLYKLQLPPQTAGDYYLEVEGRRLLQVTVKQPVCDHVDGVENDSPKRHAVWSASGISAQILGERTIEQLHSVELHDGGHWYLMSGGDRQILLAEECRPSNIDYQRFSLGHVTSDGSGREDRDIVIGRDMYADIRIDDPYVSKQHALLKCRAGHLSIIDLNSANGLYVNNIRVREKTLGVGDVISVLGMRIVVGIGFIAINSGKSSVSVNARKLERYVHPSTSGVLAKPETVGKDSAKEFYNRLPRRRLPMKCEDITIEMPPFMMSNTGIPLMLRMGGSVATGAASIFTGNPIMLLSTILFPFLTEKYSERQREDYEARRVSKYRRYLKDKAREIAVAKQQEENVLRLNYPELDVVLEYPVSGGKLWERRNVDDDFLSLRLGAGSLPMSTKVDCPHEKMSLEEDKLEDEMYRLAKEPVFLDNVPIMIDLIEHRLIGVLGSHGRGLHFARQTIMRIAALYSYDEVKLVILARPDDLRSLGFARYLPHVWNDQRTMRLMASCANDAYLISEYLAKELEDDIGGPRDLKSILRERPYYVVVSLDKQLQDCIEVIKTCSQLDESCGLSVISIFEDIPKDCTAQISLGNRGLNSLTNLSDIECADEQFRFDSFDQNAASRSMLLLSNKALKAIDTAYSLPKTLSFLEMYSTGKVSGLNVVKRWGESDPGSSLAVPVGVDTSGDLFTLDLHQKYQGPHGLVAGMTGSGKSEFLLTYILSMAVNFRPDEVSFLLIDYKGGGLSGAFEDKGNSIRLPHLAGTITNLDGSAIQRSLISLQSETLRRQRIFNEAKSASGESTMDIYSYQRLFRRGVVEEPVSHLIIISDEFAELHDQQREFLDQLISIARIGRSLGIHLILATQKPGGLVNDQILSNTRFRVCLKVQTRGDSNDMLKRPEAAELQDTGRFYLQVGYNELFALGQSAWSGAPYIPCERVSRGVDRDVALIDDTGQKLVSVRPKDLVGESEGSQISAIVRYLADIAKELHVEALRLWEPPLSKSLELEELDTLSRCDGEGKPVVACVGEVDDPEMQEKYPLIVDFSKHSNVMVVGAARSGKTTFVQSVLLQLLDSYTPDQLNVYIIDYSSRMLGMFKPFRQCGAVLVDAVDDAIDTFFDLIDGIIDERKKLFEKLGVDSIEAASALCDVPVVLVVIDNFSGMSSSRKGEEHVYQMDGHLKRGAQYGIKYLVTCSHPNEVNVRARQEMDGRFALQAKDKYEYEDILGCRITYLPPELPGRGLCQIGGRPLEMQVACVGASLRPNERIQALKDRVADMLRRNIYDGEAKRLPSIDGQISYKDFCGLFGSGCMPLGYHLDGAKPVSLPLRQLTGLSVYFGNESSTYPVLANIAQFATREGMRTLFVRRIAHSISDGLARAHPEAFSDGHSAYFEATDEGIQDLINELLPELQSRQGLWEKYSSNEGYVKGKVDTFDFMCERTVPWLIIFESFQDACYLGDTVTGYLAGLLPKLHMFNMYAIGCFYPDDKYGMAGKPLLEAFNQDSLVLLFGGRYSEQKCTDLPNEFSRVGAEGDYNRFLMKYRNKYYSLLMPCEEDFSVVLHEEDRSIFE